MNLCVDVGITSAGTALIATDHDSVLVQTGLQKVDSSDPNFAGITKHIDAAPIDAHGVKWTAQDVIDHGYYQTHTVCGHTYVDKSLYR